MISIKIFVSHRIDIDSELIENPLYVPVRCGAIYDTENPMRIQGDNTGDNISSRRMSFCEFTVQYWAWKNMSADYYGLCHYRRYLSFAAKRFRTDEYGMVHVPSLTPRAQTQYGLVDSQRMKEVISKYDIIVSEYADAKKIPTPKGNQATVHQLWESHTGFFFEQSSIELLLKLIKQYSPQYSQSAQEYFEGSKHRGFNCFVLRKDLFFRLCEFQFPIMFEFERRLNTADYSQMMLRTPAFIGEMIYGIFLYHITTHEQWRVKELQLLFFSNTERIQGRLDLWGRYLWYGVGKGLRAVFDPILPKGSKRREVLKALFYKVTRAKRRGVATIKQERKK